MFRNSGTLFNLLFLLSLVGAQGAHAVVTVETRVHDLITPSQSGESVRVMSTADGRVYDVDSARTDLVATLLKAQAENAPLTLTLDNSDRIVGASALSSGQTAAYSDKLSDAVTSSVMDDENGSSTSAPMSVSDSHGLGYQATNFASMSDAQSLFDSLPALRHKSQCFQRAHVWARQMSLYRATNSMKVFLFFTRAFIQQHRYKWWFHVAPFVYVQGQEIVLDPEFVDEPRQMHHWTDFFMMDQNFVRPALTSSPDCTEVATYTDYENNQMSQLCYTLKLPMYYYQPADAENLATKGTRIEEFRSWDVSNSRRAIP